VATDIPACLGPRVAVSRSRFVPPKGAWDTHFHILGPTDRFPYAEKRKYSPPDALVPDYLRLMQTLGIERGIVVHPNTHGFDNSVDLDAIARSNGRFFGVARLDKSVTEKSIEALHGAGMRGVRFAFNPAHGGTLDFATFNHVEACVRPFGWFIELHMAAPALVELKDWLRSLAATLVIDHMGRVDVNQSIEQEPFKVLLGLVKDRGAWVKLSGADRLSASGYPYSDVVPFARTLIAAAPEQMIWGSDWPHTGIFKPERMPDDGELLDVLADFCPDEHTREMILVSNPSRLLGVHDAAG